MRRNLLGGKGVLLLVTARWKFLALATVGEGQELAPIFDGECPVLRQLARMA
jgi:hypothetical protein